MKNLSITSIIEILTGLSQGLSYRKIQQQYGASKSSVARIATKLSSATISATQALKLADSELQELIYPSEETTNIDPDLCTYYGMEPWACKPARPKEKNRVEV